MGINPNNKITIIRRMLFAVTLFQQNQQAMLARKLHTTKKNDGKPLLFRARTFRKNNRVYVYINDLAKHVMLAENECV
jgi:hypothetical protein